MINYSVHTIRLYCRLTYTDYISIKDTLFTLDCSIQPKPYKTKKGITKDSLIFRKLPYYGFNSIELVNIKDDINEINLRYTIYFIINLYNTHTCLPNSNCRIISPADIESAVHNMMRDIRKIIGKRLLTVLKLGRVDFCIDLAFNNQHSAQEYINLLKLGIPRKNLHEYKYRDSLQHRKVAYKESFLLKCKSYEFQIYLKYKEMLNRKISNPEEASGIVRVELRAYGDKLSRLAEKYHIPYPECSIDNFLAKCPTIAYHEIPKMLAKMVGQRDFFPYDSVREKIIASKYKDSVKEKMLQVSFYFARHSNQNLLEDLGLSRYDWNSLLKKYDELGCSPIPVPIRYSNPIYPGVSSWEQFF
ncbi:MAG: hypothetical protein NC541_12290 [bacterium]|nr:hypothetical protein [bacterium]MCM1500489.1 hypothetical protein [Clostridium sp.]